MATTDSKPQVPLLGVPAIRDYGTPGWYARLPRRVGGGGILVLLLLLSGFIRVHYLNNELWSDEANTVGIATHSFSAIPGILWQGGAAPAYFLILHIWMSWFGDGEVAVHLLSALFSVLTVPVGMWLGWSLYGRRIGLMFATLLAFNAFLTKYSNEARPYSLFALVGLLAMGTFMHAFLFRRRRGWLPGFVACLALLVYVDPWGFFVWAAFALAMVVIAVRGEDARGVARDGAIAFAAATILYLPWLPTLIHQAASATAPWHYAPHLGANVLRNMLGSDRVTATLAIAVVAGLIPLVAGRERRSAEATGVWVVLTIWLGAILLALAWTPVVSSLTTRYLAALVGPLLLLCAIACARSGLAGLVLLVFACLFVSNPASFISYEKSDMRDLVGELNGDLRPGDVVLMLQPEQTPLAWYYMGSGLRYATAFGLDAHPAYMDWDNAQTRLQDANPVTTLNRIVATMRSGQRLVAMRPLTEGVFNWDQPWSRFVRLRSAQWGQALAGDPQLRQLAGVRAPHDYPGSCCTASSALVFVKR